MSMLDSFFNKGFKGAKCKTLLKLTIPRIKLLRNRREIQLKQMRRDIAKLLENGQEATARIRVEHIIREENMMAAQEIMELFCELIAVRLPIIETQRECPLDLKEAISSICFAAPRCSDLPELQQVQMLFAAKYGREFVVAASELMPDCGVNRQIIELLSVRAPPVDVKLKLLKEIAEEHEVDWDPSVSETEFLKPHEDLLNGPNHIISGSTLPLPEEKHDASVSHRHEEEHHEEDESDTVFDSFDLPEVPKSSVRAAPDIPSAPVTTDDSPQHPLDSDDELSKSKPSKNVDGEVSNPKPFQFVPFVAPPPPPPIFMLPIERHDPTPREPSPRFVAVPPPPPPFLVPSERSDQSPVHSSDPSLAHVASHPPRDSFPSKQSNTMPFHPHHTKTEDNIDMDLQDVLAAAQAAAESADRAATAARAAASLAQVRISELVTKRNSSVVQDVAEKPTFDQRNSFDETERISRYEPVWGQDLSPDASDGHGYRPQRSVSLEDDPYLSYPNLFTRQDSGMKPGAHSEHSHEL